MTRGRLGLWAFFIFSLFSAAAAPLQLVSVRDPSQAPPAGGSGDSWGPILSPDGRFVLFSSTANNLVITSNGNAIPFLVAPHLNVFLRDRLAGTTILVSANQAGNGGGNGDSIPTAISTNGRYACFESSATDLVPGDTNGVIDVFVRDLASNTTALASASLYGVPGNGVCRSSTMTPDGRYVAFVSDATNLVADDTNRIPDVFVRDMQSGVTTLVSVGAKSTNSYSAFFGGSEAPDITPDGRYVAFYSAATNLVPGVGTGGEVYVRDLAAGTTTWVSAGARALLGATNPASYNHAISADGQFVVYEASTNAGIPTLGRGAIARYNTSTGATDLISTNAAVQTAAYEDIRSLEITPDGRFVVFVANTNGSLGNSTCINLWDAQSDLTTLISGDLSGRIPTNSTCHWPAIDPAGRFIAFLSSATNLVTNSLSGTYHLFLRDVQAGTTTLVASDTNGVGVSLNPSTAPQLSADGHFIAFESPDADLVPNDRNHDADVFLIDLPAAATELISAHHPTLPSLTPNGSSVISMRSVSANGRFIAFSSDADNLVSNDTNSCRDIFLRDLHQSTNILVSANTNGLPADGISSEPAISPDGRYVAFTSGADNLVAGDTNKAQDVFLRDLQTATTVLVSWNISGTGPGNFSSYSPSVSDDGQYVLFRSQATDVAVISGPGYENLFLRDLHSGMTYALSTAGVLGASATPDMHFVAFSRPPGNLFVWDSQAKAVVYSYSTAPSPYIAISPDGNRIIYGATNGLFAVDRVANTNWQIGPSLSGSRVGLRFSSDSRFLVYARPVANTNQVYLYDFLTGLNLLLSLSFGLGSPNGQSDSPDISPDGRLIAYRTSATNILHALDANGVPNLLLYDRLTATTSLLTANHLNGAVPDNRSLLPIFSADGRTLVFQSFGSDLLPQDFNQGSDIFALAALYATISPGASGQGPTLDWPARAGENYRVQFKQTLDDSAWQDATGDVTIAGSRARFTDPTPAQGQRFYRVVVF